MVALTSGCVVIVMKKGGPRHRFLGTIYAGSMLGLNGTALMIYRLFGGFGPFHVLALLSLVTVVAGMAAVLRRRPRKNWLEHHAYWMTWSYVGLVAAAVAEITTRVPEAPFWWMVFASTFIAVGIGRYLIKSRVPGVIEAMRTGGRSPESGTN